MKKYIILGFLLVAMLVGGEIVQNHNAGPRFTEGKTLPDIALSKGDVTMYLHQLQGDYTLVDFWSVTDGASRVKSNEYNALGLDDITEIEFVSVNVDDNRELYEQIVSRDCLNRKSQYSAGNNQQVIKEFELDNGFKSYLLDKEGRIIAVNPDSEQLLALIEEAKSA